ncbi:MAG: phosphonate C-P lyase system protein PhnL [Hyphomicrobiaceae bacterium]|nr:phosphonate C-P lyase system protein PhnL [Hyphomicrobiaceae bacterium]
MTADDMIKVDGVAKTFVMHLRGGATLPVVRNVAFTVRAGECVVLSGPSGMGKSSLLKMIYGNYRTDAGSILVTGPRGPVDVATAPARALLALRATTLGYVSQFLRTIPRVGALDVVAAEAAATGRDEEAARAKARELLERLNVAERLWNLPPATFSGGEQQRVNIARGLAAARPVLLLDEPTASLDDANRNTVVELIEARKREGAAILGIFHDTAVRERLADRVVDVTKFATAA